VQPILQTLLSSGEPIIRCKALALAGGSEDVLRRARAEVPASPRVRALLAERDAEGKIPCGPYSKWYGSHWVLAQLADVDYPPGDESLRPMLEQVLGWLRSDIHRKHIVTIDGRTRRCASQESNALFAVLRLGLADGRAEDLARDLLHWQWPDGGWNCDKNPSASHSSFHESFIPLRALNLYAQRSGDPAAVSAVERAAELFLKRKLFRRLSDGKVIEERMARLFYPSYWHYGILAGLKALGECGRLADPRCAAALDLLESKRLPGGGFPAEIKFYRVVAAQSTPVKRFSGASLANWGGTGQRMNEFVTADALWVLRQAGRESFI
jgi:hypothetical protein